ncbi:gliding motility-associated peptidyl-prolyl isomerase GldI [Patiriisocius hiemis]|uniref:Peptidyl-prolyl cis-trans isomerase n=1 Tax=Patiriisocius hiemis TaxID=3075604 RepID=A0ABU2Y978_9FLAO|nr:gliding motility-associated peptidyl-prolyl isomerase GldI [Constantimarinum sp. W242]MDT0554731.1 gliding motility-associated peptidyl-prolyl isomerase GldI [Constantimarinum sp. W242]
MLIRTVFILSCFFVFGCKSPEARKPVQSNSGTFIKNSVERNKKLYEQEKAAIQSIIDKDSTRNYITSENGFWYYYNSKDSIVTNKPVFGDEVTFTYNIEDFNGKEILSEEETGLQFYKVEQTNQDLISGIREGIKLMQEGEQVTFLFPSYKAYGYYGIQGKLGSNVPVKSTITLKSINQTEEN